MLLVADTGDNEAARGGIDFHVVAEPAPDALAPASLAQPVSSDAPIRHGRRALPKAKPRYDDDSDEVAEKETTSA
jgi:hypothetical protein